MLKEVGLVSSVASPQVMEALSVDCNRLREAISHTRDLIHLKREERDKGLLKVIKGQDLNLFIFLLTTSKVWLNRQTDRSEEAKHDFFF